MVKIASAPLIKEVKHPRLYALEEYFKREERALHKHEFFNGKIIIMPGGTFNHDRLSVKVTTLLDNFVEDNNLNYSVNGSNLKVWIEDYNSAVYPDALVICEKPAFFEGREDTITNPIIVVEVLSKSTKKNDEDSKFEMYRSLESFKEYVLIHQDRKKVIVYTKQDDKTWILRDYAGEDAVAILYALQNCPLPLSKLYKGLELKGEK
jgi:Uma2 family endonuclease